MKRIQRSRPDLKLARESLRRLSNFEIARAAAAGHDDDMSGTRQCMLTEECVPD